MYEKCVFYSSVLWLRAVTGSFQHDFLGLCALAADEDAGRGVGHAAPVDGIPFHGARRVVDLSGVTKPNGKIKQIAETKTVSAIFVISLSGRIKYIVGLRGVQFVNSRNREQFVHDGNLSKRNFLIFCIFSAICQPKSGGGIRSARFKTPLFGHFELISAEF